jgi:hypothetical protein
MMLPGKDVMVAEALLQRTRALLLESRFRLALLFIALLMAVSLLGRWPCWRPRTRSPATAPHRCCGRSPPARCTTDAAVFRRLHFGWASRIAPVSF